MRIDSHLHVWTPGDGHRVLIRERLPGLDGDFSFEATLPALDAAGVERVVLVSAAQSEAETLRLLAVADRRPDRVLGVIGWIDVQAEDFAERLAAQSAHPAWRGIRLPLTVLPDRRAVRDARAGAALAHLAGRGIAEILAAPDQLADVATVLGRIPGLHAIVDHVGNPDFGAPPGAMWRDGLAGLAALPSTWCKVSSFWTPGEPHPAAARALPFFAEALAAFGAGRLIAGANWPQQSLTEPYAAVWQRLERLAEAAGLDDGETAAVFGGNAVALFAPPG